MPSDSVSIERTHESNGVVRCMAGAALGHGGVRRGRSVTDRYDRALLLSGPKRDVVLGLWEVQRYGLDSYGDENYVSLYGMQPAEWYARGVRVLGRTAVECTRDVLARAIAQDVAAGAASRSHRPATWVIDPFAGSGNTLHWLAHHLPGARAIGFELDAQVSDLTRRNVAALGLAIDVVRRDYREGLAALSTADHDRFVVFIAPPWGRALDPVRGLDLRSTEPPVADVVQRVVESFAPRPVLCAIKLYEQSDAASVREVARLFDASEVRMYACNAPGQNHGILLGERNWS
jgi:hypothetical protein